MVEIPDAKKCCFCLPLRRGLLAVGYFKLASGIGVCIAMAFFLMVLVHYHVLNTTLTVFVIIIYIILKLGILFDIIFIVSAHRKNPKILRIYYGYLIAQLIGYLITLFIYITWMTISLGPHEKIEYVSIGTGIILIIMALHIYFIYLVRCETRKLQLNILFSFKRHVDEPECTAEILDS